MGNLSRYAILQFDFGIDLRIVRCAFPGRAYFQAVKGSRFLWRIPTTSEAVQPQRAINTSSMGELAVFSLAVSMTIACRELASPM